MERLEHLYSALTVVSFDDIATLPADQAGDIILQVEDLQNQLKDLLKKKAPD